MDIRADGRIAYHSYEWREAKNRGIELWFVQYDFDGSIKEERKVKTYFAFLGIISS